MAKQERSVGFAERALAAGFLALTVTSPTLAQERLKNGVLLVAIRDPAAAVVEGSLLFWGALPLDADGNYRSESASEVDLLCRALRAGGSQKLTGPKLDEWLEDHHATLRISRVVDEVDLDFSCAPNDLPAMLERLQELVSAPAYPADVVETCRKQLTLEYEREPADPEVLGQSLGDLYRFHHDLASVGRLGSEELNKIHRESFSSERLCVGALGNLDANSLLETVEDLFGGPPSEVQPGPTSRDRNRPMIPRGTILLDSRTTTRIELRLVLNTSPEAAEIVGRAFCDRSESSSLHWTLVRSPLYLYCVTDLPTLQAAVAKNPKLWEYPGTLTTKELEVARTALAAEERQRAASPRERLLRRMRAILGIESDKGEQRLRQFEDATTKVLERSAVDAAKLECHMVAVGPADRLAPLFKNAFERAPLSIQPAKRQAPSRPEAVERIDALLAAMGGREHWKALKLVRTVSKAEVFGTPGAVELELVADLEQRRTWVKQTTADKRVVEYILDADGGWMREGDNVRDLPEMQAQALRERQDRSLFQTLRDLAVGQDRTAFLDAQTRLWVLNPRGVQCWIEIGEDGKPARLGYTLPNEKLETVYEYPQWAEAGGFAYPGIVKQLERGSQLETKVFEVEPKVDARLFAHPEAKR
jgi:hypothetical protein